MSLRAIVLCLLILSPGIASAQAASAQDGAEPAPAATPAPEPPQDQGPPGDLVTLRGGRVYRGFQVIKSTSSEVELEVTSEVTIRVPRRQIVSIQYDTIDPILEREKRKAADNAASAATMRLLSGQKVPPAIQTKLSADISDPPINYDKRDIQEAVAELNKHPKIAGLLEVDKPVLNMPAEQRLWSFTSTPGTTLAAALEALKVSVPTLATVIRNEKLLITDESTAREIVTTQEPPPADPAAPEAPEEPKQ